MTPWKEQKLKNSEAFFPLYGQSTYLHYASHGYLMRICIVCQFTMHYNKIILESIRVISSLSQCTETHTQVRSRLGNKTQGWPACSTRTIGVKVLVTRPITIPYTGFDPVTFQSLAWIPNLQSHTAHTWTAGDPAMQQQTHRPIFVYGFKWPKMHQLYFTT